MIGKERDYFFIFHLHRTRLYDTIYPHAVKCEVADPLISVVMGGVR